LYVHRRRYGRARWRRRGLTGRRAATAAVAGVILAAVVHANARAGLTAGGTPGRAAAEAIAYARAQLGKPYIWGGTGPDGFDCSGLVMEAYAADGISIPRTSQDQWAELPHIPADQARPGDLVFFPGGDGTWSAPGHVALVISATQMIQAYAPGTPVEISPLNGDGAGGIVGFARPGGA
jgi:cell wall-associated NlpC family hydrolase